MQSDSQSFCWRDLRSLWAIIVSVTQQRTNPGNIRSPIPIPADKGNLSTSSNMSSRVCHVHFLQEMQYNIPCFWCLETIIYTKALLFFLLCLWWSARRKIISNSAWQSSSTSILQYYCSFAIWSSMLLLVYAHLYCDPLTMQCKYT